MGECIVPAQNYEEYIKQINKDMGTYKNIPQAEVIDYIKRTLKTPPISIELLNLALKHENS